MTLPANAQLTFDRPRGTAAAFRRIWALVLRHIYLLMGSWPRVVELLYWPTLNILVWGFLTFYLNRQFSAAGFVASVLLGGAIMWEILIRSQFSLMFPFLEEMWSRNLVQIFVSPLTPLEYALGLILLSFVRTLIAIIPCMVLAFYVFDFWLPDLGWPFLGFYVNLAMTGWWMGLLLISLLLRFGLSAEWLAWMASFMISPIVAVYYPVAALPAWLQKISWCLPPTYVFEGMRAILNHHVVRWDYMAMSVLLNVIFLAIGVFVYWRTFEATRKGNGLMQIATD